jgi:hypothetical protein
MAKKNLVKSSRNQRTVRSIPPLYVFMYLTIIITGISFTQSPFGWRSLLVIIVLLIGAAFICWQTRLNYRRKTYDPTWIQKYQDKFDGMGSERLEAAATLLIRNTREELKDLSTTEKRNELARIDDVLDFFDDIGFYIQGDYITPEVAHHHFFHWIRGYYLSAEDYIFEWRTIESGRWNHLEELYRVVCRLEAEEKRRMKEKAFDRTEFLKDEVDTGRRILQLETDPMLRIHWLLIDKKTTDCNSKSD